MAAAAVLELSRPHTGPDISHATRPQSNLRIERATQLRMACIGPKRASAPGFSSACRAYLCLHACACNTCTD